MAKKRTDQQYKTLHFPTAGIDRSGPYRESGPFTAPDALNVRTWGQRQYRERGGSRPGIGQVNRQAITGPIRLLTEVPRLLSNTPFDLDVYRGNGLNGLPVKVIGTIVNDFTDTYITAGRYGLVAPPSIDATVISELSIDIRPANGQNYNNTVELHLGMDGAEDPFIDGIVITFSLLGDSSITTTADQYIASVGTTFGSSNVATIEANPTGKLSVQFIGQQITVWFGSTHLLTATAPTALAGDNVGFAVASGDDSIELTGFVYEYNHLDTGQVDPGLRRNILVAVGGGTLYAENSSNALTAVGGYTFSDIQLCAVSREQKLYIADYGEIASGTGTIVGTNQIDGSFPGVTVDHLLQITSTDSTVDEEQQISIAGAVAPSTFTLSHSGKVTAVLTHIASSAQVRQAFENIGITVVVVGGAGGPWDITFGGDLAAKDVDPIGIDSTNLTDGVDPVIGTVTTTTQGAGPDRFNGVYQITAVNAGSINFSPPITDGAGAVVVFRVAKPPRIFDAESNIIIPHFATKGSIPVGSRLVTLYRDRIVYAGAADQPHVWWMSRQGDPHDWDWTEDDAGAAIFAQNSNAGQLADPITAMVNHSDQCIVFGCYNSLWILRGDPGQGGTIDQLSIKVGIIGCDAWCKTPDDMMVFMSADGLYTIPAGCHGQPTSLSRERLPKELLCLDPNREHVSLEYDMVNRAIHIYIAKHNKANTDHWFYDWINQSFWRVRMPKDFQPTATHERVSWDDCPQVLLGGFDGGIRTYNSDLQTDEGEPIESFVLIGPFGLGHGHDFDEGVIKELQATVAKGSGQINWEIMTGNSFEEAVNGTVVRNGTWLQEGLNPGERPQARGHAAVLRLSGTGTRQWTIETMQAIVRIAGKRRIF